MQWLNVKQLLLMLVLILRLKMLRLLVRLQMELFAKLLKATNVQQLDLAVFNYLKKPVEFQLTQPTKKKVSVLPME